MNLNKKTDKIEKLECMNILINVCQTLVVTDFDEIKFAVFELKEAIKRLEQYLYYSDCNPFLENVSYVSYSRFIYENYLNDVYIIQTRFRTLINAIKNEKRFSLDNEEIDLIETKYNMVLSELRKITKEKRGSHVHERRYNDKDFFIVDIMEKCNNINKKNNGKPIQEYREKDVYNGVAISHLDDVQNMIIKDNNFIYETINIFLKEILEFIVTKINLLINNFN